MDNTIGARLKDARKRKKLKQIDVMKRTGINNKTLSGYENGVSNPDLYSLEKLAELYEISLDELITGFNEQEDLSKDDQYIYKVRKENFLRENKLNDNLKDILRLLTINGEYFSESVEVDIFKLFEGNMRFEPYDEFDKFYKQYLLTKEEEPEYMDADVYEDFLEHYNYETVVKSIEESNNDEWKESLINSLTELIQKHGFKSKNTEIKTELSNIFKQSNITYKGFKLTENDIKMIEVYLEALINGRSTEDSSKS